MTAFGYSVHFLLICCRSRAHLLSEPGSSGRDTLINTPTLAVNRSRFNSASLGDWLYESIKLMRGWVQLYLCDMWQASPHTCIRDLFQRLWGKISSVYFFLSGHWVQCWTPKGKVLNSASWPLHELWGHRCCTSITLFLHPQGSGFSILHTCPGEGGWRGRERKADSWSN